MLLRHLLPVEFDKYRDHLLRLSKDDRRMRFGGYTSDESIATYVKGLTAIDNVIYACFDQELNVVAALHICIVRGKEKTIAELGLSVEKSQRGKGYGHELFKKAIEWGQNRGIDELFTQCLSENSFMISIASKEGMSRTTEDGEVFAKLNLGKTVPQLGTEMFEEYLAWFDFGMKKNQKFISGLLPTIE